MLVADLKPSLDEMVEGAVHVSFADMSIDDEATALRAFDQEFVFDEQLERHLSGFLGISKSYLAKCPADLKALNINHWFTASPHLGAVIQTVNGDFASIHRPGLVVIPMREVATVVSRVFDPSFEIINMVRSDSKFQIDVKTDHHVEVESNEEIEDRRQGDRAVGDITHGAVRILTNPTEVAEPVVQRMLYRLWCTNGCTSPTAEGEIKLKGKTVDDVLEEMEEAAQRAMSRLDRDLESYAAMAHKYPPGSKEAFARQVGAEYKIGAQVMGRIMPIIEILPASATLYDIAQVFSRMANEGVPYATRVRLQHLAGDLAMDTDHVLHRCNTCERLLPQ